MLPHLFGPHTIDDRVDATWQQQVCHTGQVVHVLSGRPPHAIDYWGRQVSHQDDHEVSSTWRGKLCAALSQKQFSGLYGLSCSRMSGESLNQR